VFFEMTNAKVNDRKALSSLPMMPGITYVVDRAYNDYALTSNSLVKIAIRGESPQGLLS